MSNRSGSTITLPTSHAVITPSTNGVHAAESLAEAHIPEHVAVIMDGNGRWAAQRGLRPTDGHRAGTENIRAAIEAFAERGVRCLTLFAFSTENWKRPRPEVRGLMRILSSTIDREVKPLHEAGVKLQYIGANRRTRYSPPPQDRRGDQADATQRPDDRLRRLQLRRSRGAR